MSGVAQDQRERRVTSVRGIALAGGLALLTFFGGFGVWAASVPLSGAVIATGIVAKDGHAQTVAHESGGVIAEILIQEGETVVVGQTMVVLDDIAERARRDQLEARLLALDIRQARLAAEARSADRIEWPETIALNLQKLDGKPDSLGIRQLIADQEQEFAVRQSRLANDRDVLKTQIDQLDEERAGISGELAAIDQQLASIGEEISLRRTLADKGYGRKTVLLELERTEARMAGEKSRLTTRAESLPLRIDEASGRLMKLDRDFEEQVASELSKVRSERLEIEQQLDAAKQAVERVQLRAPVSGKISALHVNTVGSAVAAFDPVVEVVPSERPVIIEVEVATQDVDDVYAGQQARVVLSAFDPNEVQPVTATVFFVSPDRRMDERNGQPFFTVRLKAEPDAVDGLPALTPGMPVEAFLKTNERTFMALMLEPVTASLRRSFRN